MMILSKEDVIMKRKITITLLLISTFIFSLFAFTKIKSDKPNVCSLYFVTVDGSTYKLNLGIANIEKMLEVAVEGNPARLILNLLLLCI